MILTKITRPTKNPGFNTILDLVPVSIVKRILQSGYAVKPYINACERTGKKGILCGKPYLLIEGCNKLHKILATLDSKLPEEKKQDWYTQQTALKCKQNPFYCDACSFILEVK